MKILENGSERKRSCRENNRKKIVGEKDMIHASYESDIHKSYLVIEGDKPCKSEYTLQMLLQNKIPGLLPLEINWVDQKQWYRYDITGKEALSKKFQTEMGRKGEIEKFFEQLFTILEHIKPFLLKEEDLLLDPQYLYIDQTFSLYIPYVVGYQKDFKEQLTEVIAYFMDKIDYTDEQAVVLVYGIYKICKEESYPMHMIETFLKEKTEKKEEKSEPMSWESKEELFQPEKIENFVEPEKEAVEYEKEASSGTEIGIIVVTLGSALILFYFGMQLGILRDQETGKLFIFRIFIAILGMILILGVIFKAVFSSEKQVKMIEVKTTTEQWQREQKAEETETVLLFSETNQAYLEPKEISQWQMIPLTEFPFFIGTGTEKVNAAIKKATISKYHAKIEFQEESYFLVDLGSKNGTYLNGMRIKKNQFYKIRQADQIRFADVEYEFHVGRIT